MFHTKIGGMLMMSTHFLIPCSGGLLIIARR